MKICKNCGSTNTKEATKCSTCSMKGMLVDSTESKETKHESIKPIFESCVNCGTIEIGNEATCKKCNFPIPNRSKEKKGKNIANRKNIAS